MTLYLTGIFLFLASHSANIFFCAKKAQLIMKFGLVVWKISISSIAILGLLLIINNYAIAKENSILLWPQSIYGTYFAIVLNFFALWFVISAYIPRNILKIKLKHPMVLGIKLWALAHLITNGDLSSVLLFGSALFWAVLSFKKARLKTNLSKDQNTAKHSLNATFSAFFLGLMVWLYMIRIGHKDLIGIGLLYS